MGIIIRQSLKGTIVTYVGVLLGALNMLVLFPHFLKPEEFGLTRVLLSAAALIAQFAEFGGSNNIVKYFQVFRAEKDTFRKFVFWIFFKALAAFAIISFFVYFFRAPLLDSYEQKSHLVTHFFGFIFPLSVFILMFALMESYARSLLRITVPTILREIYLRVFLLVLILLYHFDYITFDQFIAWFAFSYCTAMIFIAVYIFWLDRIFVKPSFAFAGHEMAGEVFVFALFSIMTSGVWKAVNQLDVIMLGDIEGILPNIAAYSLAVYIVTLIQMPQRNLHLISEPIVANFIKLEQWQSVKELFQRVALTQFTIGMFLFLGIWANLQTLYHFLPHDYRIKGEAITAAVFILMMGKLIDMSNGFNGEVIHYSKHYKFNLIAGLVLGITCISANMLFIPKFSIMGAAISTSLALTIFNLMRSAFIYYKFGFLPYTTGMMKTVLIGAGTLAVVMLIPDVSNDYLNILIKSAVVVILFGGLVLALKVSDDISQFTTKMLSKVKPSNSEPQE